MRHLRSTGDSVRTQTAPRLAADPDATAEALARTAADHPSVPALSAAMAGIDCVILAAGAATPDLPWSAELIGANSLLPGVVCAAAARAGVPRVIHLSSAAVQGRSPVLTESAAVRPFSAYSRSKALGERVIRIVDTGPGTEVVILRATSVQGSGRSTTSALRRIAASRWASVAGDGSGPSAVSSVQALVEFVRTVGSWPGAVPGIVLQPWEQLSVADVIRVAGHREPISLPRWICSAAVRSGYAVSCVLGHRLHGAVRRAEALWFGQRVDAQWAGRAGICLTPRVREVLAGDHA